MRFKKISEVVDNQTGLIWKSEDEPGLYNFDEAIEHTKNVTGWRLPTIHELLTIIDFSKTKPACDPIFNMSSSFYWSSSPNANYSGYAWNVSFVNGYVSGNSRNNVRHVRLVKTTGEKE